MPENSSNLQSHLKKPMETSQSMHNLSKPNLPSAVSGTSSTPDQNQNMKSAVSSGNLAVSANSNNTNKQTEQRLTHEQFRAALQMVVCIKFILIQNLFIAHYSILQLIVT